MRAASWIFLALALSLAIGSAGDALSEVYRWKDSKGVVHFGDRPISTDPRVVKEVVVPRPNLADAFKPQPTEPPVGPVESQPESSGNNPPTDPSLAQDSNQKPKQLEKGVAAQDEASCEAKLAAYQASLACFDACGTFNGSFSGRNNAGCEHCNEQTRPRC
jgi:hypothetical protein